MAVRRTMGGVALRYCAVLVLAAAAHLAGLWFHSSGVYHGPANVPLTQFPEDADFGFVLTFAASIIGLKYVVYELIARTFSRNFESRAARACFYAGYVVALMIDLASLFSSSEPIADAGFALLAAVLCSPVVLIVCAAVIVGITCWANRPVKAGAYRAP
ncbi:hypothetical protein ACX80W_03390 [Arthrobacter sp. TMN-37]